ncbi:hypothetical protein OSTOST_21231, partial [Ostertagia ostertagi]
MFLLWLFPYLAALAFLLLWLFYENTKRYPKGPRPYPFVGNLLSLNLRKIKKDFDEYSKKYGGVFTVWLPKPYVVITKHELVKEAFSKK